MPEAPATKDKPPRKPIVKPLGDTQKIAAPASTTPGVMVVDTDNLSAPLFSSTVMSAAEQQRFLQESGAQLEAAVLRTSELADGDLAAYFDLCVMSGEHEKVIRELLA